MNETWQAIGVIGTLIWMLFAFAWTAPVLARIIREYSGQRNGSPFRHLTAVAALLVAVAYGGTKPTPTKYEIRYVDGGGQVEIQTCDMGRVYKLQSPSSTPLEGFFRGWACSNGKRYDDGMLVFNLANPGETVTMTAIWE